MEQTRQTSSAPDPGMGAATPGRFVVRDVSPQTDLDEIARLFADGLSAGEWMDNDTGADIQQFEDAYLADEGLSGFWVVDGTGSAPKNDDQPSKVVLVGMIGVQRDQRHEAVIRRLRVDPPYRELGLGKMLVEHAVSFCKRKGYLKVALDARMKQERAIALFERFDFRLNRERVVRGEKVLDFYLDLYRERADGRGG